MCVCVRALRMCASVSLSREVHVVALGPVLSLVVGVEHSEFKTTKDPPY